MSDSGNVEGLLLFSFSILSFLCYHEYNKNVILEEAYWGERRGRTRVEREMRRLAEVQLNTTEGFFVQPIAHIHSCFRQCVGTPRQGSLVPHSRATVVLTTNVSPESLDGLEEFSHVWLTFKFHLNTNTLKEAKAFAGVRNDSRKFTFTAKITPPMLKEKKGVLSTRSPHRPNPIGVTLARIESVNKAKRTIHVSACDLVDGTPPYVPAYDTVPSYRVPTWIAETIGTRNIVILSDKARANVDRIKHRLTQYKNDPEAFIAALVETLEADVRSEFQTRRRMSDASKGLFVEVPLDDALVRFLWKDVRTLEVAEIIHYKDADESTEKMIAEDEVERDGEGEGEDGNEDEGEKIEKENLDKIEIPR